MSETTHTPEPWEAGQYEWSIDALDGTEEVAQVTAAGPHWQADRDRIIVCVNACRGIPGAALKKLHVQDALATLGIEKAQLLVALKSAVASLQQLVDINRLPANNAGLRDALAAIARAEGK